MTEGGAAGEKDEVDEEEGGCWIGDTSSTIADGEHARSDAHNHRRWRVVAAEIGSLSKLAMARWDRPGSRGEGEGVVEETEGEEEVNG